MPIFKKMNWLLALALLLAACGQGVVELPLQESPSPQAASQTTPESLPAAGGIESTQGQIDLARQALLDYFTALNQGDYLQAVELYGGSYELLADYNPDIPAEEHAQYFQAACRYNGFMCFLPLREIVAQEQVAADEFHFAVEFNNPDGTRFELGPCCGADPNSQPPVSQFGYTVVYREDGYRVMELPVYVP
ncbi:MAG: hypothetical protein P8074_02940 [Anaerolineales bacterium]|jgi:predicted small lipoprotein YifL